MAISVHWYFHVLREDGHILRRSLGICHLFTGESRCAGTSNGGADFMFMSHDERVHEWYAPMLSFSSSF